MSNYDDDFWNDGSESTGEAETKGGNNFDPLPDGTRCLAHIENVEWGFYDPEDENVPYVKATWNIEKPSDYENRKIFHDIKLYGENPKGQSYNPEKQEAKMETARTMFWAIDKNCGGKLAALKRRPTNGDLQKYLIAKPMYVTVGLWEIGDKKGNWVRKIEPISAGEKPQPKQTEQKQKPQAKQKASNTFDEDDDIPF